MPSRRVVIGQHVESIKATRARELRRNMTAEEQILWGYLRGSQLNGMHFRRQQVIDGFIVDFYCHAAGLVIEVDGEIHNCQVDYDAERDAIVAGRGLTIMRVSNDEVRHNLAGVLQRIADACGT